MEYDMFERTINQMEGASRPTSLALPSLMRKVYLWMALALVITGLTSYEVATSQTIIYTLYSNRNSRTCPRHDNLSSNQSLEPPDSHAPVYSLLSPERRDVLIYPHPLYSAERSKHILYHSRHLRSNGIHRLYHQDRPLVTR